MNIAGLIAGLIFGLGLVLSGMADPAKVLNFLDITGTWDPSLAFVMGGAIAVTLPGYALLRRRTKPLFAKTFAFPSRNDIDPRLLTGAASFGLGWGLSGFCPGPALTAISFAAPGTLVFLPMMVLGMVLARRVAPNSAQPA
ncbi:MAG: YeeE/YedE family protein [Aliishimia sp.]